MAILSMKNSLEALLSTKHAILHSFVPNFWWNFLETINRFFYEIFKDIR